MWWALHHLEPDYLEFGVLLELMDAIVVLDCCDDLALLVQDQMFQCEIFWMEKTEMARQATSIEIA
jgi:hypothetical protein